MRNILPVHYPLFQHVPANAYLLSIIGDEPDEYDWIMNNFVNLRYNPYIQYDDFYRNDMWYNCYHITENKFTKSFLDLFSEDPFKLVKTLIDAGYYIYMFLNRRFIHNYERANEDIRHNPLIYGYDTEKNLLYIADFFRGRSFNFETCSIDEFRQAYIYSEKNPECYVYIANRAIKKKKGYQYTFSKEDLIVKLQDYLLSTDMLSSRYYGFDNNDVEEVNYDHIEGGYDFTFGLRVYDAIANELLTGKLKNRPLHLLYEHKRVMCMRVDFLIEHGYIVHDLSLVQKIDALQEELLLLRNQYVKRILTHTLTEEKKVEFAKKILEAKAHDQNFVEQLIKALRNEAGKNV